MPISRFGQIAAAAALMVIGPGFQAADIPDRHILIINGAGQTIVRLYASNPRHADWPDDILGQQVIPAGASLRVNVTDGTEQCVFNLRAEFAGGRMLEASRINVCETPEYRFTEEASPS